MSTPFPEDEEDLPEDPVYVDSSDLEDEDEDEEDDATVVEEEEEEE